METVLWHYDVSSSASRANEFRGKCPLPTHSSTSSNDSFSVSFTRNAWSCQSAFVHCGSLGPRRRKRLRLRREMERCSIREAALHTAACAPRESDSLRATSRNEESVAHSARNRPLYFTLHNINHQHPYVASRGLSEQTARYFGVGYYDGNGFLRGRVVIPIHNEHGELVAYSGRAIAQTKPKISPPCRFP